MKKFQFDNIIEHKWFTFHQLNRPEKGNYELVIKESLLIKISYPKDKKELELDNVGQYTLKLYETAKLIVKCQYSYLGQRIGAMAPTKSLKGHLRKINHET